MPGILWNSEEERTREWSFAKEKLTLHGKLLPNGSKLRRKDNLDDLSHSFMVMDGRIIALSGKGIHLGKGRDAHTKLAEDEVGNLFAVKIVTRDGGESDSVRESEIAYDLGIAGQRITRTSTSKIFPTKHYIAYQYLGTRLLDRIRSKSLSLDKCYELCIKISLALYEIHTGKNTKSKNAYQHNDIHWGNLVIDDQEEPHFIDYGRAEEGYGRNEDDIVQMLLLFFTPIKDRNDRHDDWIFGNWMGEYKFTYEKPRFSEKLQQYAGKKNTIYLYLESSDKTEDGVFPKIRYMVKNSENVFQNGVIDLSDLGLAFPRMEKYQNEDGEEEEDLSLWHFTFSDKDLSRIEDKILEVANQNNHIVSRKNRNEVLFNLLKDPTAFYRTTNIPSALDIAETLTLCRFHLEAFQSLFTGRSQDERFEAVHILNSVSIELLALYEKLRALPDHDSSLDTIVKNHILSHLFSSPGTYSGSSIDELTIQLGALHADEAHLIKQSIDDLIVSISHAREQERMKGSTHQDNSDVIEKKGAVPEYKKAIRELKAKKAITESEAKDEHVDKTTKYEPKLS